jgi:hypothetical protein
MRRLLFAALAAGLVAVTHVSFDRPSSAAPPLSGDDAAKLRALIRPVEGEDPFDTIPWETDLWAARKRAAAAGKPVLLWEMDGHPLGCG